jgi:hypothetical protein
MLAFTWTITTLFTFMAFLLAIAMVVQINSHYRYLEKTNSYNDDMYNHNRRWLNEEEEEGEDEHSGDQNNGSGDNQQDMNWYPLLAGTSSGAMTFVALYTMVLATGLSLYGSTAIVGFTSLRGVYIAPCFSYKSRLITGIFGGAVVVFANLLLLTAVIFGEFRVSLVCYVVKLSVADQPVQLASKLKHELYLDSIST